jgi:pimeloyl-ACP methyl ester carboxylesterase
MHPGSGASDRDNDMYFPPIREHLLASGFAVSSFDKRGVGGSTGRWQEAAIAEQADDVLAAVDALLANDDLDGPVGLFGHSQGGWVVVEAGGRGAPVAFVVSNSGARRHAGGAGALRDSLVSGAEWPRFGGDREGARAIRSAAGHDACRSVVEDVPGRAEGAGVPTGFLDHELPLFPDDVELWEFMAAILDYDPRPALERIDVAVLALFGADDTIVPVEDSVAVYREAVRPGLLTVAVFDDGNHRIQTGDPPLLADGYLETLTSFIAGAV